MGVKKFSIVILVRKEGLFLWKIEKYKVKNLTQHIIRNDKLTTWRTHQTTRVTYTPLNQDNSGYFTVNVTGDRII